MTTAIQRRAGRPWPTHEQGLLLRAALGTGAAAANAYTAWRTTVDIEALDGGSFRLLPLLYRNLERQGFAGNDPSIGRLKGVYRLSWYGTAPRWHGCRSCMDSSRRPGSKRN